MFKVLIEFYFVKVAIERKTVAKFSKMKIITKKKFHLPRLFLSRHFYITHVTFKALLKDSTSTILRPPSGQFLIIISSFILSFFPFQKSEQKSLFVSLIVASFVGSEENNKPRDLTLSFCHLKFLSGARISFFPVFEPIHWRIQGRNPEALPLLFLDPKKVFRTPPPLRPPAVLPLSQELDPAPAIHRDSVLLLFRLRPDTSPCSHQVHKEQRE